jgi:hypothetical protein
MSRAGDSRSFLGKPPAPRFESRERVPNDELADPVDGGNKATWAGLSPDETVLVFHSGLERFPQDDLFYVGLTGPGPVEKLTMNLVGRDSVGVASWHPALPFLVYDVAHPPGGMPYFTRYAVAFAGANATDPVEIPFGDNDYPPFRWLPRWPAFVTSNVERKGLVKIDLARPLDLPAVLVDPGEGYIGTFDVSPDGHAVAYQRGDLLGVVSLENPALRSSVHFNERDAGDRGTQVPRRWTWSPDSRFLAVPEGNAGDVVNWRLYLVQVDGVTASAPLKLRSNDASSTFVWQP